MKNPALVDARRIGRGVFEGFDLPSFAKKPFSMYSGKVYLVTLNFNCANELIGVIIDHSVKEVAIIQIGEERFESKVSVAVSRQFYGWVTSIESGMQIVGPHEVVREYLRELLGKYESV